MSYAVQGGTFGGGFGFRWDGYLGGRVVLGIGPTIFRPCTNSGETGLELPSRNISISRK